MSTEFFADKSITAYDLTITVAGAGQVGKSSIINCLETDGATKGSMTQTAGTNFCILRKRFIIPKKTWSGQRLKDDVVKIKLTDTAGQERYQSIVRETYTATDILILVYDITNPESLDRAKKELDYLREIDQEKPIVVIGNKCDQRPKITSQGAQEVFEDASINYLGEFSALEGTWKPLDEYSENTTITADDGAIPKLLTEIVRIWLVHTKKISKEDVIRMRMPKGTVDLRGDTDSSTPRPSGGCC